MKTKKIAAFLLAAIMMLSLVACGSAPAEKAPEAEKPVEEKAPEADAPAATEKELSDITIAYVSGLLTNELIAMQVQAMSTYAAEIGIKFLNAPCNGVEAMIAACENYVNLGVDAIICNIPTAEGMADCMKYVQDAGIPFFAYDTEVPGCDAFFGWNNYDYGWAIGANAAEWINKTFSDDETVYCYSSNYPEVDVLVIRENGYKDAIEELTNCNIEWVSEAAAATVEQGVTAGENWLQSGKPINCVAGINDDGCLGVLEAFKAAGLDTAKIGIFAGDATNQAVATMAAEPDGMYRGTVFTGLASYADEFIDIAVNMAKGEKEHYYYGGLWFITPENAAAFQASKSTDDIIAFKDYYVADPE